MVPNHRPCRFRKSGITIKWNNQLSQGHYYLYTEGPVPLHESIVLRGFVKINSLR